MIPLSRTVAARVCPHAPGNAQKYTDQLTGNALWFVIGMFLFAIIISIGSILAGKIMNSPHVTKMGVGGLVVAFLAAIGLLVAPGIIKEMLGSGCVTS